MAIFKVKPKPKAKNRLKVLKSLAFVIMLGFLASASVSQDDIIGNVIDLAVQEPIVALIVLFVIITYAAFHTLTFELNLRVKKKREESDNDTRS